MKLLSLVEMGWKPIFQQQLKLEDYDESLIARVVAIHRDRIQAVSEQGEHSLVMTAQWLQVSPDERPTVGDWILIKNEMLDRLLDRQSLIQRMSSGEVPKPQLIAANIDTLFIVSSCNQDLNVGRIERYLALAISSGVQPVIVLTKADLAENAETYVEIAQKIRPEIPVLSLNALEVGDLTALEPWLTKGATIAFVGSSGVGKSTLTNSLFSENVQETRVIREDDAKGRHTTTGRHMFLLPSGAWVMDTPGMRELKLGDDQEAVEQVFSDIEALAEQCRFGNCHHQGDQGCAITAAIDSGLLDPKRFIRYQKLMRETEHAQMTTAEHRKKYKAFGKMIKQVVNVKRSLRD